MNNLITYVTLCFSLTSWGQAFVVEGGSRVLLIPVHRHFYSDDKEVRLEVYNKKIKIYSREEHSVLRIGHKNPLYYFRPVKKGRPNCISYCIVGDKLYLHYYYILNTYKKHSKTEIYIISKNTKQ
jgi:hypothetical protein